MTSVSKHYFAPMGADPRVFRLGTGPRPVGIVTSGFVSGSIAEAIEEVAEAAYETDLTVFHLGPDKIVGMQPRMEPTWSSAHGISDFRLSQTFAMSKWVSGLRHVEGFEMPALEGLLCGARPIVFDRPEMRHWFGDHAMFVPECSGQDLIIRLIAILGSAPKPVSFEERATVVERFSWSSVAKGFWDCLTA